MKRYLPIILVAVAVLFVHISCLEFPGMTVIPNDPLTPTFNDLHIRNMSTTSGVTFIHGSKSETGSHTYLDPSPQSGIPVDTIISVCDWYEVPWWVERAVDSVVIDSGYVGMGCERWLLIEEDNGEWSCTWSTTEW